MGIVTGDFTSPDSTCNPKMYDFAAEKWVQSGDGFCNTNQHSQFNCLADRNDAGTWPEGARGVRFHWGTRETGNDGGSPYSSPWDGWTGWVSDHGSDSDLVDNFDSWTGKDNGPVEIYYRASNPLHTNC